MFPSLDERLHEDGNVSVSTTSSFAIFARTRNAASLSGYLTIARKSHGFARRARDQPAHERATDGCALVDDH